VAFCKIRIGTKQIACRNDERRLFWHYFGTFSLPDRRKYEVAHLKTVKMKKKWILYSLLTSILAAGLFACNKDDSPPNVPSKTTLLATGTWKLKAATINGADAMANLQDCQKDNITLYATNGNGSMNETTLKCNPADPDVVAFTWQWKNNETILSVSSPLITYGDTEMTLDKLTSTQLIISMAYTPPVGPSRQIVLEFQH
jgi:Lipocalin-like domain